MEKKADGPLLQHRNEWKGYRKQVTPGEARLRIIAPRAIRSERRTASSGVIAAQGRPLGRVVNWLTVLFIPADSTA